MKVSLVQVTPDVSWRVFYADPLTSLGEIEAYLREDWKGPEIDESLGLLDYHIKVNVYSGEEELEHHAYVMNETGTELLCLVLMPFSMVRKSLETEPWVIEDETCQVYPDENGVESALYAWAHRLFPAGTPKRTWDIQINPLRKQSWAPLPKEPLKDREFLACKGPETEPDLVYRAGTQGIWHTESMFIYDWSEMLSRYTHYHPVTRMS